MIGGIGGLIVLALALAADAFAVALVRGCAEEHRWREALRLGVAFGVAQGLMPLVGWAAGTAFARGFDAIDHWIAFTLLALLGLRMIRAGLAAEEEAPASLTNGALAMAALATSIDAAAAGVTLPLLGLPVLLACATIGVTTAVLSASGYLLGARVTRSAGRWAEAAGGAVLIGLGIHILIEHLGR